MEGLMMAEIQMKGKPLTGYKAAETAVMAKMESLYGFMNESILVRIGVKYSWDKEYQYSTELLINDGEDWATPNYIWESDWWEGQDEIEVVWAVPVREFENAPDEKFRI
jgi:hypothetical protein